MTKTREIAEYTEFMGVDIKADNIVRDPAFASDGGQNIIFGARGEINRLPGSVAQLDSRAALATTLNGIALMEFDGYSQTNTRVKKLLGFNNSEVLCELVEDDFKVVYAGAGTPSIEVGQADGTSSIILYVNNAAVYTNTTVTTTVAALVTAINAVSGWTATAASNVAYLRGFYRVKKQDIATAGFIVRVRTAKTIPAGCVLPTTNITPSSSPVTTYKIPSHVSLNNVLYFIDSQGSISKFDGHYYYGIGLERPSLTTTSYNWAGTGPLAPGNIVTVAARVKFVDYGGNTNYSKFSFSTITVGGADDGFYATVSQSVYAWQNTNYLVPSSNQFAVTTIATGATAGKFLVGDKIWVTAGGAVQERTITAVAANSITVDSATDARTTDHITHRVSIEVWCSTVLVSGTQNEVGPYYLIGEVTVASDGATKQIYRAQTDTDIVMTGTKQIITSVRNWAEPTNPLNLFPKGKYLTKFQTALVIADYTTNNVVHFSDTEGQEQFDLAVNNFTVEGEVTGIGGNKEFLAVFKENNTDVLIGDLQGFNVRVDRVDDDIGCVAHASIQKIDEGRLFFLSNKGPYSISSGSVTPIGPHVTKSGKLVSRLEPFYTKNRGEDYTVAGIDQPYLAMGRSVGCVWPSKNTYIIHTPFESRQYPGFQYQGFSASVQELSTWAFNWEKGTWYPVWNIIPNCGGFELNNEFSYLARSYYTSGDNAFYYGILNTISQTGTVKDFFTATGFNTSKYVSGWFHLGNPSTNKRFLRVRLFCHETVGNTTFTMDVKSEINFQSGTYPTNITGVTFTVGDEKKVKLSSQKARAIRISFEAGTVNENISINGIVLEWSANYHCGFKE